MTLPVFRASGALTSYGGTNSTVPKPAGVVSGDLLLAIMCVAGQTSTTWETGSRVPAGWTKILQDASTGVFDSVTSIFYKVAGPSEPASYGFDFGNQSGNGVILAYSGTHATTPINAVAQQTTASASTTYTAPSVITTVTDCMLVTLFVKQQSAPSQTLTAPTGMTVRGVYQNILSGGAFEMALPSTGASGTKGATSNLSAASYGATIAIQSADGVAPTPPTITTQPTSQTVAAGATATFSVASSGTAPSYQWRRASVSIAGATSASFTTPATTFSGGTANNGDTYDVVITNTSGTVTSSTVTLTVQAAPTFSVQPSNQTVGVGGTATFTATSSGTAPITFQWQRSIDSGATWTAISGATSASLITPAASMTGGTANNGDRFRRTDTNSVGSVSSNAATLTVSSAVTFSGTVPAQSALAGTAFSLALASYFSGGGSPYAYAVTTGTLPSGLTLNTSTGVVSGTPTAAGSATLVVRATDTGAATAFTNSFTLTVVAPGTITSSPLKNNDGTLLASLAWEAYLQNPSTGAFVIKKTGLTSNASAVISFNDGALVAGTAYRVVWRSTADGAEGLETLTAT